MKEQLMRVAVTDRSSTICYNASDEEVHAIMRMNAALDAQDGGNRVALIMEKNRAGNNSGKAWTDRIGFGNRSSGKPRKKNDRQPRPGGHAFNSSNKPKIKERE